jgi:phosphonate transport system substrate-binding protein
MLRNGGAWALLLLLLAGCGKLDEAGYEPSFSRQERNQVREYVVGIHPLHNPQLLMELYGPIIEYINQHSPQAHFRLEASHDYAEFEQRLDARQFDFAMPNPYQTLRSLKHGYRVFGKMADDEDFRGIILVRRDGGIHEVSDLRGRAVSYPAPTALAATMMTQYYLQTHGIDVNREIENRYVGSQESSILNLLRGHVAAAATWPAPWKTFSAEHPKQASQLEVKWRTEPLQNNGWVVRNDVPPAVVENFRALLFGLDDSAQGRRMLMRLPVSRFEAATDETYQPVRNFLESFSSRVRPVQW